MIVENIEFQMVDCVGICIDDNQFNEIFVNIVCQNNMIID